MSKKVTKAEPAWFQRMLCTSRFKTKIEEILSKWPTDGSDCCDHEMDVDDAYRAWNREMGLLPEVE